MMYGDTGCEKAMLEDMLNAPVEQTGGFFPACYPSNWYSQDKNIATWSFWLIIELAEYYRRTNDRQLN